MNTDEKLCGKLRCAIFFCQPPHDLTSSFTFHNMLTYFWAATNHKFDGVIQHYLYLLKLNIYTHIPACRETQCTTWTSSITNRLPEAPVKSLKFFPNEFILYRRSWTARNGFIMQITLICVTVQVPIELLNNSAWMVDHIIESIKSNLLASHS